MIQAIFHDVLLTGFGIGLCLDDFGSGFANLNSVLKLPFSVIKMDRSLLSGICPDEKAASLYRNTCSVLRNMGFTVVAEGVETRAELKLLSSWGVDMIQGFYFSPPLNYSELLELLLSGTDHTPGAAVPEKNPEISRFQDFFRENFKGRDCRLIHMGMEHTRRVPRGCFHRHLLPNFGVESLQRL